MQSIRNERQACIKPQNLIGDRSFSIAGGGGGGGGGGLVGRILIMLQ